MTDVFDRIAAEMRTELAGDASGHDIHHAWRVFDLGRRIAESEGADTEIVGASALVHDVHRTMGGDEFVGPEASLHRVEDLLRGADVPEAWIDPVLHCVAVHEAYEFDYSAGDDGTADTPAETIEAAVLQDADNLDAMGAVGVARAFAYGGARGHLLSTAHPDPERREAVDAIAGTDPAADRPGTRQHFEEKLLRLAEHLNTATARAIADDRHAVLAEFVERFEREWHGEA